MADIQTIKNLLVHAYNKTSPDVSKYSITDVKGAAKQAIKELVPDERAWERHKLDVFELYEEAYDEILPQYTLDVLGQFAEIRTVAAGQRPVFIVKKGRLRAKRFITEVGLAGVYEAFRLDKTDFTITTKAIGGAAYIDFERMTCGNDVEDPTQALDILLEGLEERVLIEVEKALVEAAKVMITQQPRNVVRATSFDPRALADLVSIAKAYGNGTATIFATPEFVADMGPDAIGLPIVTNTPGSANTTGTGFATPVYSQDDIDSIHRTGYISIFRGTPIVQLPQSYTDESNETVVLNPGVAFVFPGAGEKPVKVVFEGPTRIKEFEGRDWNHEIEVYKKIGVGVLTYNNWCVYINTTLSTNEGLSGGTTTGTGTISSASKQWLYEDGETASGNAGNGNYVSTATEF